MTEYEKVLKAWAEKRFGRPDAKVTNVSFEYDEGYRYSEYTYENPSFKIIVYYEVNGDLRSDYETLYEDEDPMDMGSLMTELFAIAAGGAND
ncbi:MAG TPA: hypothetical protein VFT53_07495 [Candidatus Saccharimonadales bacterium]|nr:hypothetical protein [Candidatus Saccharimonadales bacterium]